MAGQQKKILIFAKPAIGDILLATPLMRSIRLAEPDVILDVMCYPGQEAILEGNRDIDNIVTVERRPRWSQSLDMLRRLWRKYDLMITNAADDRVHLYLFFFGRQRVSVTLPNGAAWKRWITFASVVEGHEDQHALLRNNQLGNLLGYRSQYEVVPPVPANGRTGSPLPRLRESAYAVIHPEARLPYKRWTLAGWAAVTRHLSQTGLPVYLTGAGGADERQYHRDILQGSAQTAESVAGELSFAATSELIAGATLYLGIDTVNSHIAAAHGVPTIALFGPEKPARWGPWPAGQRSERSPWRNSGSQRAGNVLIIQGSAACGTCVQGACLRRRDHGSGCPLMAGISIAQVMQGIQSMLPPEFRT